MTEGRPAGAFWADKIVTQGGVLVLRGGTPGGSCAGYYILGYKDPRDFFDIPMKKCHKSKIILSEGPTTMLVLNSCRKL